MSNQKDSDTKILGSWDMQSAHLQPYRAAKTRDSVYSDTTSAGNNDTHTTTQSKHAKEQLRPQTKRFVVTAIISFVGLLLCVSALFAYSFTLSDAALFVSVGCAAIYAITKGMGALYIRKDSAYIKARNEQIAAEQQHIHRSELWNPSKWTAILYFFSPFLIDYTIAIFYVSRRKAQTGSFLGQTYA